MSRKVLRMMRLSCFAVILTFLTALPVSAQEITVQAARIHDYGSHTRIVFDMNQAVEPSVFTLAAEAGRPYRVVIDLPEVVWAVDGGAFLPGEGLIDQVRYGRNRPGQSRIVLDLPVPATILDLQVLDATDDAPARIVMDLTPEDAEAFLASSGFPEEAEGPPTPDMSEPFADIEAVLASLGEDVQGPSLETPDDLNVPARMRPVIVIDPGHGGRDPGATTIDGIQEKTIALEIGRAMRDALLRTELFDVYLTRNEDIFLQLNDRYAVAQDLSADLFISVHVDSNDNARARGVTVYTLSENASDEEAARVAARENQSDRIAGYEVDEELTRILIDLAQRETMNLSAELAAIVVGSLAEGDVRMVSRPHRFAGFRVLTAPDVPSVLLETGFASNRQDAALLVSSDYQRDLSQAMAGALVDYFDLGGVQNAAIGN